MKSTRSSTPREHPTLTGSGTDGLSHVRAGVHHMRGVASTSGNERINAFCDGVFAIVITLLVLEIKIPEVDPVLAAVLLPRALGNMAPKFVAHGFSFAVLGIYWVGHHNLMQHIRRHNRAFLWLTIMFLLCVASMPFPTGMLIRYLNSQLAVIVYGGTLIVTGLALDAIWAYANRHHLASKGLSTEFVASVHRRILTAPMFYLVAIGVSFFSVNASLLIFALTAVYYIIPNPFDRSHHHAVHNSQGEIQPGDVLANH